MNRRRELRISAAVCLLTCLITNPAVSYCPCPPLAATTLSWQPVLVVHTDVVRM
jgi:hypothetical protein